MTTNGQAPFITVFMYIDEVPEGQTREDLVAIIEEMLHQRIRGVKNEKGVWITPAFPKLIYVLEEDNIHEDSKYYYLTKLAAECSAKRLVPDYISEGYEGTQRWKLLSMYGCRSFLTVYHDENNKQSFMAVSIRVLSQSILLMLHVHQERIRIVSGRSLMSVLNCVTVH